MRKGIATLVALSLGASVFAQGGYITNAEKEARKKELAGYAQKLLDAPDSHKRVELLKEMVDKDVFRDGQGRAVANGFATEAFVWLYQKGLESDDANARLIAVIGLSSLEAPAAADALVDILNAEKTPAVQLRAIQAIEKAAVARAGKDVLAKLRSVDSEVAAASARCLAALGYDPQNQSAGLMIELMAQTYNKLMQLPADDAARPDLERLLEVLAQSCVKLVPALAWSPGQGMDDLGKEVAKFTGWWNARFLPGLKDAKFDARREALARVAHTADRAAFAVVLDAVQKEVERIRSQETFAEKQLALQFVVDGSAILSRISGLDTKLQFTSTTDEMAAAVKQWQDWLAQQK